MTTVQFYHLTSTPFEHACPKLVEKAYGAGFRVHMVLANDEQADYFNDLLWTYDPASFLPHGVAKDGNSEQQPVYLSCALDAPNKPNLLFVTEGSAPVAPEAYERILDLFDGKSEEATAAARERWKAYKNAGHVMTYWRQTESGGWEKAA